MFHVQVYQFFLLRSFLVVHSAFFFTATTTIVYDGISKQSEKSAAASANCKKRIVPTDITQLPQYNCSHTS
jgi:hypothetical protein